MIYYLHFQLTVDFNERPAAKDVLFSEWFHFFPNSQSVPIPSVSRLRSFVNHVEEAKKKYAFLDTYLLSAKPMAKAGQNLNVKIIRLNVHCRVKCVIKALAFGTR